LGFADLESAAGKNAVAGLGLAKPSSSFEERRILYIFVFLGFRRRFCYGFSENGREKRKKQILPPK